MGTQQVVILYQLAEDQLFRGSKKRFVALIYIVREKEVPNLLESGYVDYLGHRPDDRADRQNTEYNSAMIQLMLNIARGYGRRWTPFWEEDWDHLYNLNPPYDRNPATRGLRPTDWRQGEPHITDQRAGGFPAMAALATTKRLHLGFQQHPVGITLPVEFWGVQGRVLPNGGCETWEEWLSEWMDQVADEWKAWC